MSCDSRIKYVLLTETNDDDWAFGEWKKNGLETFIIFNRVCKFLRAIRRFGMKYDFPLKSVWYSKKWKKIVCEADVVVLHMSYLTLSLPKYINEINSNAKVIAWYWNIVNESYVPSKIVGKCECWSFDPEDCKKYGMKFNHQYYFKTLIQEKNNPQCDVYFCGSDSGRGRLLVELYDIFMEKGLKAKFQIVYPKYEGIPENLKANPQKYEFILENNLNSKVILELMRPGQTGATARQMEALFQKRKLITNNTNIKNEDFYRPQNIFILGERPLNTLADFINAPYDHSVDKYIDSYDVFSWLKKFVK